MDASKYDRVLEIVGEALELDADRRAEFAVSASAGDAELLQEVQRLLGLESSAVAAMPTARGHTALSSAFRPPTRIGPYTIIREIGHGGMGAVYLATQSEPIRRAVAVKLLLPGMDTRQVLARFESERNALALMSHPNVAQVLDAGADEMGRPFVVMEYVDGMPITDYCDSRKLNTLQRIELFTSVCDAIQHAHQKAIIHRDIKPSNVLVMEREGRAIPKVIDFGIARAIDQNSTERAFFTEHGQLVGTPEYMSPEQASGVDIDTRSDVYSLGVLLYELLTGTQPFDSKQLRSSAFDEIRRIIREVDPPRPSTKLSEMGEKIATVAEVRGLDPKSHARQIRGELDWITMRAMEKERGRRYASPAELAADLERHLRNEPVLAGPPSGVYRARKFVRRHRVLASASTLIALSLFAGIATTSWQAIRARRAETVATDQAQRATAAEIDARAQATRATAAEGRAVKRFDDLRQLVGTFIFDIDTVIQEEGPTAARKRLVETAIAYLEQLSRESSDPSLTTQVINGYLKVGLVQYYPGYPHLGDLAGAEISYTRAVELARKLAADHPENPMSRFLMAKAEIFLAKAQLAQGRHEQALATLFEARSVFTELAKSHPTDVELARNEAMAIDHASDVYRAMGDGARARAALEEAAPRYEAIANAHPDDIELRRDVMVAYSGLAGMTMNMGLPGKSIPYARRAVAVSDELLKRKPGSPYFEGDSRDARRTLCETLLEAGRLKEVGEMLPQLTEQTEKAAQDDAANLYLAEKVATCHEIRGRVESSLGQLEQSVASFQKAIAVYDHVLKTSPGDVKTRRHRGHACRMLAGSQLELGKLDDALASATAAVETQEKIATDSPEDASPTSLSYARRVMAEVMVRQGKLREARDLLTLATGAYDHAATQPTSHPTTASTSAPSAPEQREFVWVLAVTADVALLEERFTDAASTCDRAMSIAQGVLAEDPDDLVTATWLARLQLSRAQTLIAAKATGEARVLINRSREQLNSIATLEPQSFEVLRQLKRAETLEAQISR